MPLTYRQKHESILVTHIPDEPFRLSAKITIIAQGLTDRGKPRQLTHSMCPKRSSLLMAFFRKLTRMSRRRAGNLIARCCLIIGKRMPFLWGSNSHGEFFWKINKFKIATILIENIYIYIYIYINSPCFDNMPTIQTASKNFNGRCAR